MALHVGEGTERTCDKAVNGNRLRLELTGEPTFMAGKWLPFFGPDLATCELIAAAAT